MGLKAMKSLEQLDSIPDNIANMTADNMGISMEYNHQVIVYDTTKYGKIKKWYEMVTIFWYKFTTCIRIWI